MTARLTAQDVIKVASLARLRLSDDEVEAFTPQLAGVLSYVDLLDELDVSDVAPMVHAVEQHNVLRDDVPQTSLTPAEALRNAPKSDGRYFLVPPVFTDSAESV
jgi:aspartyl-tRNA(Asn)/glutamyl-tRNA(Gln) amidotransferase subunit C